MPGTQWNGRPGAHGRPRSDGRAWDGQPRDGQPSDGRSWEARGWDGRSWGRPERFRPSDGFVLLAPVIISFLLQVPAAIWIAVRFHSDWPDAFGQVALAAAGPLALLASRRHPGPTVAVVSAAALADVLFAPEFGPPYVALAFAIVLAVVRGALIWAVISVVAGWVAAIALGAVSGLEWHPFQIAATTVLLAVCFGIGTFVRGRRERVARYWAEAASRRQTAEQRERVRIARELHDVIGHALSQINVQASVGLHLMDRDPEQARAALASVKDTSKSALDEVRSVLGVIRGDDGAGGAGGADAPLTPQAELAELPRLVGGIRSPGFDAELVDRLEEAPGRAVQFAAYRIAQEALTNVVRHAGASHAVVTVERIGDAGSPGDELLLTVDDDGSGILAATEGSGLLGMRERAALLGGCVDVAPSPRGGTRVTARLPWAGTP